MVSTTSNNNIIQIKSSVNDKDYDKGHDPKLLKQMKNFLFYHYLLKK